MERVEQRLEIVLAEQKNTKFVKVQESDPSTRSGQELFQLIEQLELPELCLEERLDIAFQLRESFGVVQQFAPALVLA